jgi:hypothetical protein
LVSRVIPLGAPTVKEFTTGLNTPRLDVAINVSTQSSGYEARGKVRVSAGITLAGTTATVDTFVGTT